MRRSGVGAAAAVAAGRGLVQNATGRPAAPDLLCRLHGRIGYVLACWRRFGCVAALARRRERFLIFVLGRRGSVDGPAGARGRLAARGCREGGWVLALRRDRGPAVRGRGRVVARCCDRAPAVGGQCRAPAAMRRWLALLRLLALAAI